MTTTQPTDTGKLYLIRNSANPDLFWSNAFGWTVRRSAEFFERNVELPIGGEWADIEDHLPPDPEGQNDERAEWANHAINAFASITRMDTACEDNETILGDLLTDLMHWCDRQGIDFDRKLTGAVVNYEIETSDDN